MSLQLISWFELSTHAPEKKILRSGSGKCRKKYFFPESGVRGASEKIYFFRESGVGKSDNITNFRFGQILVGGDCCGALGSRALLTF